MKHIFNLQLFADDAAAATATHTLTADEMPKHTHAYMGGNSNGSEETQSKTAAKYTDEDIDRIINQKFAEWQKKQDKTVEAAKAKEREAAKLERMDAQQKAEYQLNEANKRIAEFERKENIAEQTKIARKMLSGKNITVSDELLTMMVTDNAEQTKSAVDGFAKAFTEAVENAVKERLKGAPPRKGTGGAPTMTKAQIMAIKDPELRQKAMLEHRELFKF